jgi:hypothetical protein
MRKTARNITQNSWCPGRDSNTFSSERRSGVLALSQTASHVSVLQIRSAVGFDLCQARFRSVIHESNQTCFVSNKIQKSGPQRKKNKRRE